MNDDVMRMVRLAVIIAGALILGYFFLGLLRDGGHRTANVAGAIQKKID